MNNRNPFRILGVSPDAEMTAVRNAYQELARRQQPDSPPGDGASPSPERMAEITWALEELEANYGQWRQAAATSSGRDDVLTVTTLPSSGQDRRRVAPPAWGARFPLRRPAVALLAAAGVVLLVAAVVLFFRSGSSGGTSSVSGHYADTKLGYSFDYPKSWSDVTAKVKLATGKSTANLVGHIALGSFDDKLGLFTGVQVTVVQTNQQVNDTNMDAALADLDNLFQQFSASVAGRESDPQSGELGGLKARQYVVQFVYHSGAKDEQIATAQTVTFFGEREYTVNCQGTADTFDTDIRPGCEVALQSFHFK